MKFLLVLFFFITTTTCANILAILPAPYYSHLKFQEKVLKTLLDRGHTVTALVEGTLKTHENLTQYNLNCSEEWLAFDNFKMLDSFEGSLFLDLFMIIIRQQIAHLKVDVVTKMIEEGSKNHFDLIISESFTYTFLNQFAEMYDCPIVLSLSVDASLHIHYVMGDEVNPNMLSETLMFSYDPLSVTFSERMKGTFVVAVYMIFYPLLNIWSTFMMKTQFRDAKESASQIEDRIALVMTNTHPALGTVRPTTNLIHVGFLDIEQPKPLPDGSLKDFVDGSESGIILVNFGSVLKTSSIPEDVRSIFSNVFAKLPYRVIWKFDDETVGNISKNVFLSSWHPQIDLLGHPKIKLLITHGGMNSVQEAIEQTVPMLIIPVIGDQMFYARLFEQKEYGVVLHHCDISKQKLNEAIDKALDPKYKTNLERLREIVYSFPMSSRETVVWWIEHVIKKKGLDYMRYPGRKVPFYRKYYLDLIASLLATIFILKKVLNVIFIRRTQKFERRSFSNEKKVA